MSPHLREVQISKQTNDRQVQPNANYVNIEPSIAIDKHETDNHQQLVIDITNEETLSEEKLTKALEMLEFSNNPLPQKKQTQLRIFYNNINGLEINNLTKTVIQRQNEKKSIKVIQESETYSKFEALLIQMSQWEVNVTALAEPCVDWKNIIPRRIIRKVSSKYNSTGCYTVATSDLNVANYLKPGGALIHSDNEWSGRITEKGTDPWGYGRWAYQIYSGGTTKKLLVVSAYRVGKRSNDNAGTTTAWYQQQVLIQEQNRDGDPSDIFVKDLITWMKSIQRSSMEVILLLDANERWTENSKIKHLADTLQLSDIFRETMGDSPITHPNFENTSRSTTIDFCLVSRKVIEHVDYLTMAPYDLQTLGDHRGILLDIDIKGLLDVNDIALDTTSGRKLSTDNPKAVQKYLEKVRDKFQKQNIYERTNKLLHQTVTNKKAPDDIMRCYEILEKEIFHICKKAESKCRRSFSGLHQWSPKLKKAIQTLSYWRARLKYNAYHPVIQKLGLELNITFHPRKRSEIQDQIKESRKELVQIQKQSAQVRKKHLEDLAEQYSRIHNISKATAIQELLTQEEIKLMFSMLGERVKQKQRGQMSTLWVARDENGNYTKDLQNKKVYTNKETIEELLLQRNAKHLSQAQHTPFARHALLSEMKWDGTGTLTEDILSGEILNHRKFSASMQLYLECLKSDNISNMNIIHPTLSLEEYRDFLKKKNEKTVTSPFGLHLGHYKSALQEQQILEVHRIMLLIPFKIAKVPTRWRKTVQTMLQKESHAPWIHRLRIIELFDAQVNAGFQIFIGRKMVRNAVAKGTLHESSYGSTPGQMASSAILQKVLVTDQLRIERRAGGIFDCDATGCYDRILPHFASVHLQKLGLSKQISTFLARMMYHTRRYVKTKHGISTASIQPTRRKPLFGIGQGNGGGPAIWLAHLNIMFQAISSVCKGAEIIGIENNTKLSTVGTGYVDDVTLNITVDNTEDQTESMVRRKIKHIAQTWEELLFITGGKLELSKCFWVPITWKWEKSRPKLNLKQHRATDLVLRESETHEKVLIPRLKPTSAEKRLGVNYSVDGSWNQEHKYLMQHTAQFANKITLARLDRISGYHVYHSLWVAKYRYSAPVISLSTRQMEKLETKIVGVCLSAAGYNCKMPRAVVFGPTVYGGMGWEKPLTITIIEKLKLLMGSIRRGDVVGHMLLLQLSWLQLFSGISTPILEEKKEVGYLPVGWLTTMHKLLAKTSITIKIQKGWTPRKQRENDIILMDYARHHLPFWTWESINTCRMFLKSVTLSDITSFDGVWIPEKIYTVTEPLRKSWLNHSSQVKPTKPDIHYWQYFLKLFMTKDRKLHTPLGNWYPNPYQKFPYITDLQTGEILRTEARRWIVYTPHNARRNHYTKTRRRATVTPIQWCPTHVIKASDYVIRLPLECKYNPVSPTAPNILGKFDFPHERQVVGQYVIDMEQIQYIYQQAERQELTVYCGADGGLKDRVGTSGYTICLEQSRDPFVYGHAAEAQGSTSASSTRQELLAQLACTYWIQHIDKVLGAKTGKIHVVLITDSSASVQIVESFKTPIGMKPFLKEEADVGMELAALRYEHSHITYEMIKVRSHIDRDDAPNERYWELNDFADRLATEARDKVNTEDLVPKPPCMFPNSAVGCYIDNKLVTNDRKSKITTALTGTDMMDYLCMKHGWTTEEFHTINWAAHHTALKKHRRTHRATLHKYLHGWLSTNSRKYLIGRNPDKLCPLCGREEEQFHFFYCTNTELGQKRYQLWDQLKIKLSRSASRDVIETLQIGRTQDMTKSDPQESELFIATDALRNCYRQQVHLGWHQIYLGRFHRDWTTLLQKETELPLIRNLPQVIRDMWTYGLQVWQHRNQLCHNNSGSTSLYTLNKINRVAAAAAEAIKDEIEYDRHWLLQYPAGNTDQCTYSNTVAWLDSVRRLYPEKYKEAQAQANVTDNLERDISEEYTKANIAGTV